MSKQANVNADQLAPLLEQLSPEEIEAAANELHAYAGHRRSAAPKGAQQAPFNFKNFLSNFVKVVQVVWPVIGPLIGAAPGTAQPAPGTKRSSKT